MSVRITGLQEVATLQSGDYIAIDNESNGTHKFDAMKMGANMASNIAPAYSTAATYAIGDFCMHDNILYKCTTAISTPESWTASHWTQTSAGVALAQKVDKVSGKGLSQNDFTNTLKTKLDGIASGAEVNVQANWTQTNTSADDYIKNKPVDATSSVGGLMSASDKAKLDGIAAGAEVNVQANWTETNTSSDAYIKNKPTNATSSTAGLMSAADKAKLDGIASGAEVNVQADWSQTNTSADDYIKNKPVDATSSVGGLMSATDKAKLDTIEQGAEVNVQADWSQTNTSADDYIKNKPTNATTSTAGLMSASDKTKLNGIETGAQVNVIDGVKVDGTLLTVDGNKDVDIVGKANQASLAPQYSSDTGDYVRGNYVIYQNNLYKCLQDTSGVWDATKWEQVDIGTELEDKANIDGLYEEMTVGGAEQLISDTFNIESVPYNFRTSGGSLNIGDRETDKLIGGTVAWNQLVNAYNQNEMTKDGLTKSVVTDFGRSRIHIQGTYGTPSADPNIYSVVNNRMIMTNHVYLVASSSSLFGVVPYNGMTAANSAKSAERIAKGSADRMDGAIGLVPTVTQGTTVNVTFDIIMTDLTQAFGTTIADYIYSLEQNTEGAGVAFFKKLFPAPYYAYNAGQLMSVNAGSHVMNGFNQWDEVWEVGGIDGTTGQNTTNTTTIRSKNYIPVIPNQTYYIGNTGGVVINVHKYAADKSYLGNYNYTNQTFTIPSDVYYLRLRFGTAYGTTYKNDTCINISWDGERNGEYEPYVSHTYELDDALELRGLPKLDANNQLYYDGDVYESDGSVTRKYGIVDLGTYSWSYTAEPSSAPTQPFFATSVTQKLVENIPNDIICTKYASVGANETSIVTHTSDKSIRASVTSTAIYIRDSAYTDATAFKNSLSGVYLVFPLVTPTTESATPYTNPQIVNDWGTETYTDYSYDAQTRDVQIPVGHETRYMANLKAKLETAPESPNGDGDYIVRQTSGENAYVAIGSSPTIQHKAEIDGHYEDMVVGNAEQLLSKTYEEDRVPYIFRVSGGGIAIGDREELSKVVGGTVAWNQIVNNGNFASSTGWSGQSGNFSVSSNVCTLTVTTANNGVALRNAGVNGTANHVFVATAMLKPSKAGQAMFYLSGTSSATINLTANAWNYIGGIIKPSASTGGFNVYCNRNTVMAVDDTCQYQNVMLTDLTAMLGTTIADYIYSLETATAGTGIAKLKEWGFFRDSYYSYDSGSLQSVCVGAHSTTGKNLIPLNATSATISGVRFTVNDDGSVTANGTATANAGFQLYAGANNTFDLANGDYILTGCPTGGGSQTYRIWIDNRTSAGTESIELKADAGSGQTITITEGKCRVYVFIANGQTVNNLVFKPMLRLSSVSDATFEPYEKHSYALDSDLVLRGRFYLENGQLRADGDEYVADGTVTRKRNLLNLGNINWGYSSDGGYFYASVGDKAVGNFNLICAKYTTTTSESVSGMTDKQIKGNATNYNIYIKDSNYTDAATFKTAMLGVYLDYELATPTTETADPYTAVQICDSDGTEEFVDALVASGDRDVAIPAGHDTKYTANLRAKIEIAPDSPSGNGDYIMRQANGTNSYVPLVIPNELPTMPTTDGTYRLQVVVASGTPTLSWVSAT